MSKLSLGFGRDCGFGSFARLAIGQLIISRSYSRTAANTL